MSKRRVARCGLEVVEVQVASESTTQIAGRRRSRGDRVETAVDFKFRCGLATDKGQS